MGVMFRLPDSDLADWRPELRRRWVVFIDATGRGPYWATCYPRNADPIRLRADELGQLRAAVERYEQENGVPDSEPPKWLAQSFTGQ